MLSEHIAALRISLASPEDIRSWSYGEVTLPESINFRTHKPVKDGLFCERIFGPTEDWTCFCRKYRRERRAGLVCEKCGVELAPARVRRERMGHIQLAAPVVHPWFSRGSPSIVSLLLGLSVRKCASVLAFTGYLVTQISTDQRVEAITRAKTSGATEQDLQHRLEALNVGDYLEESEYRDLCAWYGECFHAGTGAQAVQECLTQLDLEALSTRLREECRNAAGTAQKRCWKHLQVIEAFRTSGVRPEWMVLTIVPVLPPDLRPLVPLAGGRLATSDLNALYERVLHRNSRIRHFEQHKAPAIILNQEKRMLQEAVDALFDNAHKRRPITNTRRQALKSLTDTLSGKTGRFRLNLLGKRVDYSGRSVIVGNPSLFLHQCGLPKKMACELFKPFLIRKLVDRQLAHNVKHAKHMVERRHPAIWDQLAECLFERVVLLNRAPTLHRLSIQAFEPVLVEGSALQLHPQVCSAFNADFDGDQMAVHLPLSDAAQAEARALMLPVRNLRSPASGEPSISISQEQVLGLYYLTEDRPSPKRAGRIFTDMNEAMHALETGVIDLHTKITVRLAENVLYQALGQESVPPPQMRGRVETTVGRLIFNHTLPQGMRYRNYPMTKEALKQIVAEALSRCGEETTAQLCDALKTLGFRYATRSGISFALSDMTLPPEREELIRQGKVQQEEMDTLYHAGEITYDEWYRQVIDLWTQKTEQISTAARSALSEYGTLMTIVKSGATKAKFQQIRQLSGIRGLMASPTGMILPVPVLSNYLLGLLVWEIFIAASGARKGFMDRSLNTATSGYLTRKLVEVGMSIWITMIDCGTTDALFVTHEACARFGLPGMRPFLVGRILAEPIFDLPRGTLLSEEVVDRLLALEPNGIWIRSPLTCHAAHGLCQQCYGRDPGTGYLVRRGAAVGVVAGQSIGEPGTQLTMRTFHSGGIANAVGDITQGLPRVSELFEVRTPKKKAILSELSGRIIIEEDEQRTQKRIRVIAHTTFPVEYRLPRASQVFVEEQAEVQPGDLIAVAKLHADDSIEIRTQYGGRVAKKTASLISLSVEDYEERSYSLPSGSQLLVQHGQDVEIGTLLTAGTIDPKELLLLCGVEAVSRYLVGEVQRVYRNTGVYIRDQHPEIIVRQMLRYVQINHEGDTSLLPGDIVDRYAFEEANGRILAQGGEPASARPVILGLTRTALQTSSWIAAASFQETSRVLTQAAIRRQVDPLLGLKEKIVLGLLIPTWAT